MITSQREMIQSRKGRLAWHRNNTTPGSPRPSQQPPRQTQQPSRHEASERPSIQASKHPASSVQTSQLPKARANQNHNGNCAQRPAAAAAAPPTAPPCGYGRSSAVYLQAAGGAQLQRWLGSDPTRFLTQGALSHHPYLPRTTHHSPDTPSNPTPPHKLHHAVTPACRTMSTRHATPSCLHIRIASRLQPSPVLLACLLTVMPCHPLRHHDSP
jgi:hypothetical protein